MSTIKPPFLKKGDKIAIVAPAGIIKNKQTINYAVSIAKQWGLECVLAEHLFDDYNHFSATDQNRAKDLQSAIDDNSIKAIWCARGGYGSVRIIDEINFSGLKTNPKWIIGFSDITVIHSVLNNMNIESIHATMPANLVSEDSNNNLDSLSKCLFGAEIKHEIKPNKYNVKGIAKAKVVGGNLSMLHSTIGTRTSLSTDDKILFIEEIGEYMYVIDRMLQNLKRNGFFDNIKGLIVGTFSGIPDNDIDFGETIEQVILEYIPNNIPVCFGFEAGHTSVNNAFVLGRELAMEVICDEEGLSELHC
ncbi:MAG: LD-carboxypeptidase [Flavobacteriaceae bacterium]|nr:LD-carboxypeptidase [Flavobacteriaceae bacterium]